MSQCFEVLGRWLTMYGIEYSLRECDAVIDGEQFKEWQIRLRDGGDQLLVFSDTSNFYERVVACNVRPFSSDEMEDVIICKNEGAIMGLIAFIIKSKHENKSIDTASVNRMLSEVSNI